ncbi:hypothetical protein GPB2148_1819 [marine gamma proteobacterium HTCC2148]|nr:hypothetical protein GPB2148_1819 [marine gamma proteobacterium HTCC2148]
MCGARHDGSDIVKIISTTEGYGVPFTKITPSGSGCEGGKHRLIASVELETVD